MDTNSSAKMSDLENIKASDKNEKIKLDPALESQLSNLSEKIDQQMPHTSRKFTDSTNTGALIKENEEYRLKATKLEEENKELKNSLLRLAADKENIIKRMERQISDTNKYAISSFLKDLLPAVDNLYRTVEAVSQEQASASPIIKTICDGIEMTKNDFTRVFEKNGLVRISPKAGDSFDHNYHQAVATIPGSEIENGKIVSVMQAGYELSGRLVRAAMVTVSSK